MSIYPRPGAEKPPSTLTMRRMTPLLRFSTTLALLAGAARANQGLIQEVLSFGTKDMWVPHLLCLDDTDPL